jgi:hypothetical protein
VAESPEQAGYIATCIEHASAAKYHGDELCEHPSLSSSLAWLLVSKSELHVKHAHPRFGRARRESTDEMEVGQLQHALVLGAGDGIVVVRIVKDDGLVADDWRTKAAKQAREMARAQGKTPVLQRDIDRAQHAADTIKMRMEESGIALGPMREVVLLWVETATDGTPVQCRALLDSLDLQRVVVGDLKTGESANPKQFINKCSRFGYHVQAAAYLSAVHGVWPELEGRAKYEWILAEQSAPYAVALAEPSGAMLACGRALWQQAIDRYARALKTGRWPGYARAVIDPPAWMLADAVGWEDDDVLEEAS